MRSGKKTLVIIMVILILLLSAGGVFAYVYMATDIFKTDRELFFKYFAQITSSEEGFIEKGINNFNEKKKQTSYENSGDITVIAQAIEGISENIIDKVNDLSIKFSGKVDSKNQKVEQKIEVDYGNGVIFPVNYRQDGNKIGLQFDELSKQFISVRNENLDELMDDMSGDGITSMSSRIDGIVEILTSNTDLISGIELSDYEKNQLQQIYSPILQETLVEEKFTSIKTGQNESYTLEISSQEIKDIIIKMMEKTKENTLIMDKLNESALKIDPDMEPMETSDIDEIIESFNEVDVSQISNLKITLVHSNKKLNQIIIQSGESQIAIAKNKTQDNLSYEINCEIKEAEENKDSKTETNVDNEINLYFKVQYTGLDGLNNVQEKYEIGFDIKSSDISMGYDYKINNSTQFNDSVSIESLDDTVAVLLNDHDKEQVTNFLTQVGTRLIEINKTQMEKLGLKEYENPLLYTNPITSLGLMMYNMASETITDTTLSDYEIEAFNTKFLNYVGEEVNGRQVFEMINAVVKSNNLAEMDNQSERYVKVTIDNNEIDLSNSHVEDGVYMVEAIYNDEGYIVEMKVTTK